MAAHKIVELHKINKEHGQTLILKETLHFEMLCLMMKACLSQGEEINGFILARTILMRTCLPKTKPIGQK